MSGQGCPGTGRSPGLGSGSSPQHSPDLTALAPQGAGLGLKDAQGTEVGNAWHLTAPCPVSCPPLSQSVVPKSPAGTHRPGRLENPFFAIGHV